MPAVFLWALSGRNFSKDFLFTFSMVPCIMETEHMFDCEGGDGKAYGAEDLSGSGSEIILCIGGVCGARTGSADDEFSGGGCLPHGEDDLPGGVACAEGVWDTGQGQAV